MPPFSVFHSPPPARLQDGILLACLLLHALFLDLVLSSARTLTQVLLFPWSFIIHPYLAQNTSWKRLCSISCQNKPHSLGIYLAKSESCVSVPRPPLAAAVLFSACLARNQDTFLPLFSAATIAVSQNADTAGKERMESGWWKRSTQWKTRYVSANCRIQVLCRYAPSPCLYLMCCYTKCLRI